MNFKVLTIIPARGGSKGVPKKNVKPLAGKPLMVWTIEAALSAKHAGRVIVSTNNEQIAEVARAHGAEVPFLRPEEISGDLATDQEFVIHALDTLEREEGYVPDIVARFSPTTPLRTAATIDAAIELLMQNPDVHSVRPIARLSHHPYKAWRTDGEHMVPAFSPEVTGHEQPYNMPRQLFPEMYQHLGASGVAWTKTHRDIGTTSGTILKYVLMDELDAFDINHPLDFDIAEVLMKKRLSMGD